MLTNDQLERLIQNLIERMNRVEANTARQKLNNASLTNRLDAAIATWSNAASDIAERKHDV